MTPPLVSLRPVSAIGTEIKAALQRQGRTQAWLARELNIDAGSVSRWATGRQVPSPSRVPEIEALLDVELAHLSADDRATTAFEVFLATPMAAFGSSDEYEAHRLHILEVLDLIEAEIGPAYWAGRELATPDDFDASAHADQANLEALRRSRRLLFVHLSPTPLATSALIEMGIALGWRIPVTVLAPSLRSMPYMVTGLPPISMTLGFIPETRFYEAKDVASVKRLLKKYTSDIFGGRS